MKRKLYSFRIPQWRKNVLTLSCIMDFVWKTKCFVLLEGSDPGFKSQGTISWAHVYQYFLFSFFFFLSRFIKAPYPGFVLLDCSRFIKKQWLHELCFFLVTVLHINIIYDVSVRILNIEKKYIKYIQRY